jgi:hypothetical protein
MPAPTLARPPLRTRTHRYAILAIADHFDHATMFGFPLVKQERNPHNYFKDHQARTLNPKPHTLNLTP